MLKNIKITTNFTTKDLQINMIINIISLVPLQFLINKYLDYLSVISNILICKTSSKIYNITCITFFKFLVMTVFL